MLLFIFIRICSGLLWSAFQYISCYSLSETESGLVRDIILVSIHLMLLFIWRWYKECEVKRSFNTSHVTLYPLRRNPEGRRKISFNTSHVTLYRSNRVLLWWTWLVSIHLMLLFITSYIPIVGFTDLVSIHLMLLFIPVLPKGSMQLHWVSIHLMLLFIRNVVISTLCIV